MKQSRPVILLMTRPAPQSQAFADQLLRGAPDLDVLISPVLKMAPADPPDVGDAAGLVFTSQNGVRVFAESLTECDLPVFCLGERTTRAAVDAGLSAIQVGRDAATLVAELPGKNPPTPLLHLRGEHSTGEVAQGLSKVGVACRAQVIYRQDPVDLSAQAIAALHSNSLIILPIFSPRTARLLSAQCSGATARLVLACISPAVQAAWTGPAPLIVTVAETPDAASLRRAILEAIATLDQVEGDAPKG